MFPSNKICRVPDEMLVPSTCKFWTHSLALTNYPKVDISVIRIDGIERLVIRTKRTDKDNEFTEEMKRYVILPKNIDWKQLQCTFTKDGLLVKVPYVRKAVKEDSVVNDVDTHGMVRVCSSSQLYHDYVVKAADGSGGAKFVMDLPLAHCEPEDVTVKHMGKNVIVIEANHKVEDDGQVSFVLPDTVDGAAVAASRIDDHVLRLEAPVCATVAGIREQEIGIVTAKSPNKATPRNTLYRICRRRCVEQEKKVRGANEEDPSGRRPVEETEATLVEPVEPMETAEPTKSA